MFEPNALRWSRRNTAGTALGQLKDLLEDLGAAGRDVGLGSVMLAGAAGCAVMTLVTMHQTALRALEAVLPRSAAGALLAAGYGTAAAVLVRAARSALISAADAAEQAVREQTD